MTTFSETLVHAQQAEDEAVTWAQDVKGISEQKVLEAYRAGFQNGWRMCFANLRLHKLLQNVQGSSLRPGQAAKPPNQLEAMGLAR